MTTTRIRGAIIAASLAAAAAAGTITGYAAATHNTPHAAPAAPITCTTPVDDRPEILDTWTGDAIDAIIDMCDHRRMVPDLCEEDAWCAIAEVNDTGDYTGRHTPGTR